MKKKVLSFLVLLLVVAGCNNPWKKDDRLVVVSTIFPFQDIASRIGGSRVRAEVLIAPGVSEHTYEPRPSDMQKVAEADMVLVVGAGLDDWVKKLVEDAGVDKAKIVDLSQWVELRQYSESSGEKSQSDPHYWLSPQRMLEINTHLTEELARLDSRNKNIYEINSASLGEDLKNIDLEMKNKIGAFSSKDIVTFHEAFGYLAADYGLNVVGTIEPVSGAEPTAEQIQAIIDQIKLLSVKAVFSEPQLSSKILDGLKNDLGIEVGVLDPLGGIEGRGTYIGLMKYNLLELTRFLE